MSTTRMFLLPFAGGIFRNKKIRIRHVEYVANFTQESGAGIDMTNKPGKKNILGRLLSQFQ